jgi:inhibitor of KinA sporulation pathway (predicted exonuclease)
MYVCILDFEATCWEHNPTQFHEIIEFPSVLLHWQDGDVREISRVQLFVKPRCRPVVSPFCRRLTGITQEQVDVGMPIQRALSAHHKWLSSHVPSQQEVMIVTCGACDLKGFLPNDLRPLRIKPPMVYRRFINLKSLFEVVEQCGQAGPMTQMLNYFGMPLEGQHHSGIDDCHNIGRLFARLVHNGLDQARFWDCVELVHAYDPPKPLVVS